jgi:cytochrome b561
MSRPSRTHFAPLLRIIHWSMALLILTMLFIGVAMVSTTGPAYVALLALHRPLGIGILALALLRLAIRLATGSPPCPRICPRPRSWPPKDRICCSMPR